MELLNENDVIESVCKFLEKKGFLVKKSVIFN
jgi:hypothetical protein